MGTAAVYYLHGILMPSGTWINELTDTTPAANVQHLTGYGAGQTVPDFRSGHGSKPDITFRSPQIKTILDACGLYGYDMSAGNCDLYYRAAGNLSTRDALATESHTRLRCVRALMYWDSITAHQGADGDEASAEISCRIIPTYDGTNPPFVPLGDQAIPSCALADEYYGLGPIELNTTEITGISQYTLNLNPTLHEEASSGENYLSFACIQQHDPVLEITTRELPQWATVGIGGLALTAIEAWLRCKKADSVNCYADGDAQHIKFTGTKGLATLLQSSGGADGPADVGVRAAFRREDCSASHVMSVNTACAIA